MLYLKRKPTSRTNRQAQEGVSYSTKESRIYLAEYFASLINRVDINAETFLLNQTDQTNDLSKQARIDQSKIVETINERKTELFASQLEEDPELLEKIKDIGLRLEAQISTVDVPGIGLKVEETLLSLQKIIFNNKSMWFFCAGSLEGEFNFSDENNKLIRELNKRVGVLIVLKDEFVPDEFNPDNLRDYRYS